MTAQTARNIPDPRGGDPMPLRAALHLVPGTGPGPLARALAQPGLHKRTPEQVAADERADLSIWIAERDALQRHNRHRRYLGQRPSKYATATYDILDGDQNPGGKVSRWLAAGPRVLVMTGPSRTGKTTAAYAIGNDAHGRGKIVEAWTAGDLSDALKPDRDPGVYDRAASADLLILDDLGADRVTDWWLEQLYRLADARCANERRLIVTTNLEYDNLVGLYGNRVVERLLDDAGGLKFTGPKRRALHSDW
jgi:DNA replication protein DnaC